MVKNCLICGKEFKTCPCHIKIGHGKYCSNKCVGIARRGYKFTEEQRKRVSLSHKGLVLGEKNPMWKGGKTKVLGYIWVKKLDHPFHNRQGYVPEHRLIVEKYLGRYLLSKEQVHHINKIRDDNRKENLMVFTNFSSHIKFERNCNIDKKDIVFDGRN